MICLNLRSGGDKMVNKKPQECTSMEDVRQEIDRLDEQLVKLIGERFTYVDMAWKFKENPEDATVPWRIQQVIERVRGHAEQEGVPPRLIEALWRQMIGWFIQYEEEKLDEKRQDK